MIKAKSISVASANGRILKLRTPQEELTGYERQLMEWIETAQNIGKTEPEEPDSLLRQRSRLQLAIKQSPRSLSHAEQRRLRELDALLVKHKKVLAASLPLADEVRRRYGFHQSHWWWHLGLKEQPKRRAKKQSLTVTKSRRI